MMRVIFDALRRWFRRGRIAEIDRIKLGALPTVATPKGYVCEDGEIVRATAYANAESESGKSLGSGLLILSDRGMAFIGGRQPIRYTWRQIESSGVRFNGRGSYSIDTRRGRTIDFQLSRHGDAEQLYVVDYALNAPDDEC